MAEKLRVGKVTDIPEGSAVVIETGEKKIAVFHVGDNFHAISNTCPHKGGPLGEGAVSGDTVTCPLHAWEFNVKTGESLTVPEQGVERFKVTIENGDVFVEV